jgi:hypothetical protein
MSVQTSPNLDDLLRVLNAATDKRTIKWSTTASEDTFRAVLDFGMVTISAEDLGPGYILTLLDRDGIVLEQYRSSGEGTLLALEALHKKARHQALEVDEKLKDWYNRLKSLAGEA